MQYKVVKSFTDYDGAFRMPGDIITVNPERARLLRNYDLISGAIVEEPKVKTPVVETAVVENYETPEVKTVENAAVNNYKYESRKKKHKHA